MSVKNSAPAAPPAPAAPSAADVLRRIEQASCYYSDVMLRSGVDRDRFMWFMRGQDDLRPDERIAIDRAVSDIRRGSAPKAPRAK